MRDIYCPICAEPWDLDGLHDVADEQETTFKDVYHRFQTKGCVALGTKCGPSRGSLRAMFSSAAMELGGDDVDGVISDLEDIGPMFGL